jgi:hypothetical protein
MPLRTISRTGRKKDGTRSQNQRHCASRNGRIMTENPSGGVGRLDCSVPDIRAPRSRILRKNSAASVKIRNGRAVGRRASSRRVGRNGKRPAALSVNALPQACATGFSAFPSDEEGKDSRVVPTGTRYDLQIPTNPSYVPVKGGSKSSPALWEQFRQRDRSRDSGIAMDAWANASKRSLFSPAKRTQGEENVLFAATAEKKGTFP